VCVGFFAMGTAVMTPDWDPASFGACFVQRDQVVDEMITTFDLDGDLKADVRIIQCIWDSGIISDFYKRQIPDGPDGLVMYCDTNEDGYFTRAEVMESHTCVANCATANSVHAFRQQVINNSTWVPMCRQYA
jgi:hypothetical protein